MCETDHESDDITPRSTPQGAAPDSSLASKPRRDIQAPGPSSRLHAEVETLLRKVRALPARPVMLEAFWDGDTVNDWFVVLVAILPGAGYDDVRYCAHDLGVYTWSAAEGILDEDKVLYPQGRLVSGMGALLSKDLGIPFQFIAQDEPDDEVPRWWDGQPPAPPSTWTVVWQRLLVHTDGLFNEEEGTREETAATPREAHRCVIDELQAQYSISTLEELGIERVEIKTALLGLPSGPVRYNLRLTPTSYQVWGS